MKKLDKCFTDNCIETQSSCTIWNGGDIEYLGICNGESINNLFLEIITKLQELAGEDLSNFDIDSLLEICSKKAPLEINLLSILNIIKDNQVCLKDYIKILEERINEITTSQNVNINLKCYSDFDNLGNSLQLNRDQFDQLLINILCEYKQRIETIEGKLILIQTEIDNFDNTQQVEELSFPTCIDSGTKPTSTQVITIAENLCDLRIATGTPSKITTALSQTPADFDSEFSSVDPVNWIPAINRTSLADNYNNLLIAFGNLLNRVKFMEQNCCNITCKDIELGFSTRYNEDRDGLIITFTSGSGTYIPNGFTDNGSTIVITDAEGATITNNLDIVDMFVNGTEVEISIITLSSISDLKINIDSKLTNGSINCDKCLNQIVKRPGCAFCTLTATDNVTIVYKICVLS